MSTICFKVIEILYSNSIMWALFLIVLCLYFKLHPKFQHWFYFFFKILKKDKITYVQAEKATRMPIVCFYKLLIIDFLCKQNFSRSWLVLVLNNDMTFSSNKYQRLLDSYSKSFLGVLRGQICDFAVNLMNNQQMSISISVSFSNEGSQQLSPFSQGYQRITDVVNST